MNLKDAKNEKEYIVEKSMLKQPQKRRLEAMGLIEGTNIRKINEALDGSVIFMVRGTRLAISEELANDILVRDLTPDDLKKKKRGRGLGPRNGKGKGMGRRRGMQQCEENAKERGTSIVSE